MKEGLMSRIRRAIFAMATLAALVMAIGASWKPR